MMRNKKDMYRQIYKIIYLANINNIINESKYIDILQKISNDGFKTYHVEDFDRLTMYMQNIGLNDSFNISLLLYLRDINYKKLSEIAMAFDDVGIIFSAKKNKMVDRVHLIGKFFKNKLKIIKSFKKIDIYSNISKIIDNENPIKKNYIYDNDQYYQCDNKKLQNNNVQNEKMKIKISKIKNMWKYNTKNEIINRLYLIANEHYNISQLKLMEVEIKSLYEIENLNYELLELYYINVIKKIELTLREWEMLCRMYVDIEINYVECCHALYNNKKTILKLKNFNIKINTN